MILLIDNYDSFTWNLVHYLQAISEEEVVVHRNDALSVEECLALKPTAVVISPGPCDPDKAGISLSLIQACADKKIPMYGVCLGFQALCQMFGGKIVRAPAPVHGKTAVIEHTGDNMFAHVQNPFTATRYHSLIAEVETLPKCFDITAKVDNLVMAVRHKSLPLFGVQFHPESIATQSGHQMLYNFLCLAKSKAPERLTKEFVL